MSQDNPNSLPPDSPETVINVQPLLTRLLIKILRGTIGVLEGVAVKLEKPTTGSGLTVQVALAIAAIVGILIWTTVAIFPRTPSVAVTPIEDSPPVMVATPQELTSPAPPQPVKIEPEIVPVPPVVETPPLTPEQNLVATIEDQVMEISDRFASGLIQSISVDFDSSNLTIKVSDDWYTLPPSQQDQLANRMLERSGSLDFTHLEITDSEGKLLARNPVVGNQMVIFKRA
jgi:hypothetical protein